MKEKGKREDPIREQEDDDGNVDAQSPNKKVKVEVAVQDVATVDKERR